MRLLASILCGLCGLCVPYGVMCVLAPGAAEAAPATDGVSVMSASDSSPDRLDARARRVHGEIARRAATDALHRRGIAAQHTAAGRQIDVAVTHWRVASAGTRTDVTAEIRIVLCDRNGRMLSIANAKATVRGDRAELASLRAQAITEGIGHLVVALEPQIARASA